MIHLKVFLCIESWLYFVDEEDIFGSDFESTDEETAQVDVDAGDKAVDEEERRARKVDLY